MTYFVTELTENP